MNDSGWTIAADVETTIVMSCEAAGLKVQDACCYPAPQEDLIVVRVVALTPDLLQDRSQFAVFADVERDGRWSRELQIQAAVQVSSQDYDEPGYYRMSGRSHVTPADLTEALRQTITERDEVVARYEGGDVGPYDLAGALWAAVPEVPEDYDEAIEDGEEEELEESFGELYLSGADEQYLVETW